MSTTISFVAEESFSKQIGKAVASTGLYQSKSEFVRAAVREKLERTLQWQETLERVETARKRLQKKAKFTGYLSQEERDKLAQEYMKSLKG